MKKVFSRRPLTAAVFLACTCCAAGISATTSGLLPTTVVVFGQGAMPEGRHGETMKTVPIASLERTDLARLSSDEFRKMLVTVSSSALPLSVGDDEVLRQLVGSGVPVFIRMDARSEMDRSMVAKTFGISSGGANFLLRKDSLRGTQLFVGGDGATWDSDEVSRLLSVMRSTERDRPVSTNGEPVELDEAAPEASRPARHFDINFPDATNEITGVVGIDIVRSHTGSADNKMITVISSATIAPARHGLVRTKVKGRDGWGAFAPLQYSVRHSVRAQGIVPTYLDHFPLTDGATTFKQTTTKTEGFTIGGSVGSEVSTTGKPDEGLAAKLPFNVSLGYSSMKSTALETEFTDYSLRAAGGVEGDVTWTAVLAPVKREPLDAYARRPIFPAKVLERFNAHLTPMMHAASLQDWSRWKVPGTYEGDVTVDVAAGYELWQYASYESSPGKHVFDTTPIRRDVSAPWTIDMSDPYLTPEITVLIQSVERSGGCMVDDGGVVGLAACDAGLRHQLWGLDAQSRYVNRGSGRCLAIDEASKSVIAARCVTLSPSQQWQWRADRLHALSDPERYRLFVQGGQVRYDAPPGRFDDIPVNPYTPVLLPWAGYPSRPTKGDFIPSPGTTKTDRIPDNWADDYSAVGAEQRWRIQVLRAGL